MPQTLHRICPICSKCYFANPARLKIGKETTCSRECSYKFRYKLKDLTGRVFSRLTVIARSNRQAPSGAWYWLCQCTCGKQKEIFCSSLLRGLTQSCGCLGRPKKRGIGYKIPEYRNYTEMIKRCQETNLRRYKDYGGRGITVCPEWLKSFKTFYEDMGPKPSPKHSIERKNNNLGYSKNNCKWATQKEQSRNTRRNVFITYQGETLCIKDWGKKLGISWYRLRHRMKKQGMSFEQAITFPKYKLPKSCSVCGAPHGKNHDGGCPNRPA